MLNFPEPTNSKANKVAEKVAQQFLHRPSFKLQTHFVWLDITCLWKLNFPESFHVLIFIYSSPYTSPGTPWAHCPNTPFTFHWHKKGKYINSIFSLSAWKIALWRGLLAQTCFKVVTIIQMNPETLLEETLVCHAIALPWGKPCTA